MKKVLIANRGEIACRIIRTLRRMNIQSVAVYSEADRDSPHVAMADEAVFIGAAPASMSYLDIEKLLDAARKTSAEGIHPGYGFLSENAAFARAVEEAGITFIGPSARAIEVMGSKLMARETVTKYNIPLVPGTDSVISDEEEARLTAISLGFPVLIKASAGGGGKGMRIVHSESEFDEQLARARSEALNAFGDDSVFIEKYVSSPRHIEIQVLGDAHGNYVHLAERDCSIQRRHQKVIEEAPSPVVDNELRAEMGRTAINVARSCQYKSVGTVEFILDQDLNYYFLEMNTRLQVEHPVTEMITGLDLVEQQILVAMGRELQITQGDIGISGHSIELRVYAEDPANSFLPSIGVLTKYRIPEGDGVRVDDGLREGLEIPIHYDPMIAKLVVHASDRASAIEKMEQAIDNYNIAGVKTTLPFGTFVMGHNAFRSGNFDTHFVPNHYAGIGNKPHQTKNEVAALVAGYLVEQNNKTLKINGQIIRRGAKWRARGI